MLEYKNKVVQELAACICDRCHRRMTPDEHGFGWHERVSLSFHGGFDSLFGDGSEVSVDLCPQCVMETLGKWLRITAPYADGLAYQDRLRSESDGRETDHPRPPCESAGGGEG